MSYEYEEVINLIVKTDSMNSGLKAMEEKFNAAKADLENVGITAKIKTGEFVIDLKKLEQERIKSEERTNKAILDLANAAAKAKANLEKQTLKENEDRYKISAGVRINAERLEARELYRYRREMDRDNAREEREIAKALHQYRMDADKEEYQARMQQLKQEAQARQQARQFSNIFTPGGMPLARAGAAASTINASAGLRTGAGIAASVGAYPVAGALYASANAMQVLGVSTVSTTTALAVFVPTIALVGAAITGYKFIEWGAEFSRELAKMSTLMADSSVTGAQFAAMLDRTAVSALKISSAFNIDKLEVVKAFKEALSSGIDAADLERFTTTVAKLATATGSGLQSTANLLTSLKDAYQLSIGEVTKVSDLLFNSINVGKLQVEDFNAQFGRLASVGAVAGISLRDLNAGVDLLTRQGMKTSNAITSMIAFINGLQNPSAKAAKELEKMGIATGELAFKGKNLIDIIQGIKTATGGSGDIIGKGWDEERARRFVAGAVRGLSLLKNDIVPALDEVGTSAIASGRALDNLADNFGKRITAMSNTITLASSRSGGWLNELIFGSEEDRASRNKAIVDTITDIKNKAKSVLDRGITDPKSVERNVIAKVDPSLLGFDDAMTNSTADQRRSMAKIKIAIEEAYAEAKDSAVVSLRSIDEEVQATLTDTMNLIDKMIKVPQNTKMSKVDVKEFNSRATDAQKQKLDDLASEKEDQQELLDIEKERLRTTIQQKEAAFVDANITPIEDALRKATAANDNNSIPALKDKLNKAREEFKAFSETVKEELTNTSAFDPFIAKMYEITLTIESMRAKIATQDDRGTREAKEAAAKKATEAAHKEVEDFNRIAERLYKEDTSNYEKAQKARENVFKKINKEIESEAKRSADMQADIQNKIMESKGRQHSDDPGAMVRIGRASRDTALDRLKNAANGTDRGEFEAAKKEYDAATEMIRSAMTQIDQRRAERNYQDDQENLSKIISDFDKNYQSKEREAAMAMTQRDNSVAIRSPQQIAKDANQELKQTKEIEKIVLDAQVNLQVDGDLSPATENKLTEKIIAKIQQAWKNRNPGPSNYDPRTRTGAIVTTDD